MFDNHQVAMTVIGLMMIKPSDSKHVFKRKYQFQFLLKFIAVSRSFGNYKLNSLLGTSLASIVEFKIESKPLNSSDTRTKKIILSLNHYLSNCMQFH